MQTLKPAVVRIEYAYGKDQDGNKLKRGEEGFPYINHVSPVRPEDCYPLCCLDDGTEWCISTHMRANGNFVDLALKLDLPAPYEDYSAAISSSENGERETLRTHCEDGTAYFLIPIKSKCTSGGRINVLSNWITSAGMLYLHLSEPGEEPRTVPLRVYPSSMLEEDYQRLLKQIRNLHQELLLGRGQTAEKSASVNQRREQMWKSLGRRWADLERQADQMKSILRRIEAAPERELVAVQSRLPGRKVKKLTPKALTDQAAGLRLLRTGAHEESFDLYEHRMIRTYLEALKKQAEQYQRLEAQKRRELEAMRKQVLAEGAGQEQDAASSGGDQQFYSEGLSQRAEYWGGLRSQKAHDWEGIARKADQMLDSPLLRDLRGGERLHTSNLFTKHLSYRRAYRLMRETQPQLMDIELWSRGTLPVGSTQSLYEIWCLLKMLSIWINDYSFTLISPTIRELPRRLLRHLSDEGEEVSILLRLEQDRLKGMELRLDYDRPRRFEENGQTKELRPDYFLTISYPDKTDRPRLYRFCMDAKYRNYSPQQQGVAGWYEDLLYVAWYKYLFRLRDGDERINGAYILHSDAARRELTGGQDMGRYFWSQFGGEQQEADPNQDKALGTILQDWKRYTEKDSGAPSGRDGMLERIHENLNRLEDCRISSVRFTPLSDDAPDAPFRTLMQMIMEHFLGTDFPEEMYRTKCWICGSEDLDVQRQSTAGRSEKYYVTCNSCKDFWVQNRCLTCNRLLGKHRPGSNYYREIPNSAWNVVCPDCGSRLGRAKKASG